MAMGMAMAGAGGAEGTQKVTHKGYELPPYTVERSEGAREIRVYGPHLLAEVRVAGGRQAAIQAGFRTLAGYIFGGNAGSSRIAMTAPVAQQGAQQGTRIAMTAPVR